MFEVTLTYYDGNTYRVTMGREEVGQYIQTMLTIQVEKVDIIAF